MISTLIEQSPALVQAIREVFTTSGPCHCHGAGKLSEEEVVNALVRLRHITVADAKQQNVLPIMAALRTLRINPWYELQKQGVKFLPHLQSWTRAELMRVDRVGSLTADGIETVMAKYGLALRGGDPSRFQHLIKDEPEPGRPPVDLPPDEIREHCATELINTGQRLLQYGAGIMKFGLRASRRVKVGGALKRTANTSLGAAREVENIAHLLHDLERREATPQRLPKRGSRVPAKVRQQGNVITGAFVPQADPSDAWAHGRAI